MRASTYAGCARSPPQHGRRVAMLVDDAGDASLRTTEMLATAMLEHGLVGRGVANHARALGLYARPTLERLAGLARRAGLGFVSDPHTGSLHLPVRELTAWGSRSRSARTTSRTPTTRSAGTTWSRSPSSPRTRSARSTSPASTWSTTRSRRPPPTCSAYPATGSSPAANADLVVHHHAALREVLAHHAPPAHVVASGKLVGGSPPWS